MNQGQLISLKLSGGSQVAVGWPSLLPGDYPLKVDTPIKISVQKVPGIQVIFQPIKGETTRIKHGKIA